MDVQSHILWRPFFAPMREGKNIKDDKDLSILRRSSKSGKNLNQVKMDLSEVSLALINAAECAFHHQHGYPVPKRRTHSFIV